QVTTSEPHGLTTGDTIRITGSIGGTFSGNISTTTRTVTVLNSTSFQIQGVNCTAAITTPANARLVSSPCRVTTQQAHGLTTGDSVTINGVSGGSFTTSMNANNVFPVTMLDTTSFTIVNACTSPSTDNTGNIVGANTLDVPATGMVK